MDAAIKAQWVAALRSGDYEQGVEVLRSENAFCCLGVLCDLHSKATGTPWSNSIDMYFYIDKETLLPSKVIDWAGIEPNGEDENFQENPGVDIGRCYAPLSQHNDGHAAIWRRRTFAEIAAAIEAQL